MAISPGFFFIVHAPGSESSNAPPPSLSKISHDLEHSFQLSCARRDVLLPGGITLTAVKTTSLKDLADAYAAEVVKIIGGTYKIKLRTGKDSSTPFREIKLTHLHSMAQGLSCQIGQATTVTVPGGITLIVAANTPFAAFADDYFAKIQKSPAIAALRAQRQNVVDEAVLGIQHAAKRVCPFDQTDESLKPVAEALLGYMKLISRDPAHMDRSGIIMKKYEVGAMLESMTRECTQRPGATLGTELNLMGEKLKTGHTIGPRDIKIMTDALQTHQITQQPSSAAVMHGLRL